LKPFKWLKINKPALLLAMLASRCFFVQWSHCLAGSFLKAFWVQP